MTAGTLAPMDVAARADRLRAGLGQAGCDALLVTDLTNVRYLTGFTGSAALLLVLPAELVLVSDGRYGDQAELELAASGVEARLEIHRTLAAQRDATATAATGTGRLGLEAAHVSWAAQRRYAEDWFPEVELVATSGLIEDLRQVKDDGELARMAEAARVADSALAQVRARLGQGPTESEVALELEVAMRRLGASGPAFDTIVAAGPNGARPHARPGPRTIGEGDLVVIDFGAVVDGYRSDMTRTLMVGEPSPTQARMLEVVAASQAAGLAAVAPGVECTDVDEACRNVIAEAGWGEAFTHGTGHGVGLDIHEEPRVSTAGTGSLMVGQVLTVEPGVYLVDHGGVRIEDTVVVAASGGRPLTRAPKDVAP